VTALLLPVVENPAAPLARRNPVAKVSAALIVMTALVLSVDPVTPSLVLVAELAAVPLAGLSARALFRRGWPVLLALASIAVANALYAADQGGRVLVDVGPILLTSDGLAAGATAAVRLLAIALPGILVVATTDPVDLADSLVQQWRLSPRFAYGALAALRMVPLLSLEWRTISVARRARGVDAGRSPVAAVRLFLGRLLTLLVGAIRRGTRLAVAMDARGFGTGKRTAAREQVFSGRDWALLVATLLVVTAAVIVSMRTGSWNPVLS
jgi:energy-coupling factor transport system permease protein